LKDQKSRSAASRRARTADDSDDSSDSSDSDSDSDTDTDSESDSESEREREKAKELERRRKEKEKKEREKAISKKLESPKISKSAVGNLVGDLMSEAPGDVKKAEAPKKPDAEHTGDGWGELEDFFATASGKDKKDKKGKPMEKEKDSSKRSGKSDEKADKRGGSDEKLDKASCEARIKKREEERAKQRTATVLAQLEAQCGVSGADDVRCA
jgi:hypothetical protein